MSRLPQTDEKAFNHLKINLNHTSEKRETLKEQIKRIEAIVAKEKAQKEKARKLAELMKTKPMFIKSASKKDILESTDRWYKENEKRIKELS